MDSEADREIEGEVTRLSAVRYLQGALGHATGSLLFLLVGGLVWAVGSRMIGWLLVAVAVLLSANGLSIWAWTRLVARFTARDGREEPTRTLQARPLSAESLAEMKAGAIMTLTFVGLLLLGRLALAVFSPRVVATLCVVCLVVANVLALVWHFSDGR